MSFDANISVWIVAGDQGGAAIQAFVDYTENSDNDTHWSIEDSGDDSASGYGESFDVSDVVAVLEPIAKQFGVTFGVWYKNDYDDEATEYVGDTADIYALKDRYEEAAEALRELENAIKSSKAPISEALALLDKRDLDTLSRYGRKFEGD